MRLTAKQIVNKLLEYGIDPDAPRPGQPNDPWRQTTSDLVVSPDTFTGQRPPQSVEVPGDDLLNPEDLAEPDSEVLPHDDALDTILQPPPETRPPVRPSIRSRFKWRPPTPPGP